MDDINKQVNEAIKNLRKIAYDHGVEIREKTYLRRAGKVAKDKLSSAAPVVTGNLRDAAAFLNFKKDKEAVYVGHRYFSRTDSEGQRKNAIAPHSHLVEFGFIDRAGNRVEGNPIVKQTYELTRLQVLKNLEKEVEKLQQRLERKYGKA